MQGEDGGRGTGEPHQLTVGFGDLAFDLIHEGIVERQVLDVFEVDGASPLLFVLHLAQQVGDLPAQDTAASDVRVDVQGTHRTAYHGPKRLIQMDKPPMHTHAQAQHLVLGDAPKRIHTAFVG